MIRIYALLLLGCLAMPAAAGYETSIAGVRLDPLQVDWLDGLLDRDARALLRDGGLELAISDNALPMDMFRRAAALPSDGFILVPAADKPTTLTQPPDYGPHLRIFRLLLLDARRRGAAGDRAGAEADLLAAAGFVAHLAEQRAFALHASAVLRECAGKAYPFFAESLTGRSPSPSYMKQLALRLNRARAGMEGLAGAMSAESAELAQNLAREKLNLSEVVLARGKMPFYKRYAYRRMQNEEYFKLVYSRFDEAAAARAAALSRALAANDPAPAESFVKEQLAELDARDSYKGVLGFMDSFRVSVGEANEVRSAMADSMVYALTKAAAAEYWQLVPGFHYAAAGLDVLRAALAVKEYQRRRGRLPDSLGRLTPAFLREAPKDPFNSFAPLGYSRAGQGFSLRAGDIVYQD